MYIKMDSIESSNNSFDKNVIEIKNDIMELNNLIDEKCLKIYEINEISENKIIRYKLLMENIILEYHKICKEMFNNN
jgi:hypothetical protein